MRVSVRGASRWCWMVAIVAAVAAAAGPPLVPIASAAQPKEVKQADKLASTARIVYDQGQFAAAAELYRKAYRLNPAKPDYLWGRGRTRPLLKVVAVKLRRGPNFPPKSPRTPISDADQAMRGLTTEAYLRTPMRQSCELSRRKAPQRRTDAPNAGDRRIPKFTTETPRGPRFGMQIKEKSAAVTPRCAQSGGSRNRGRLDAYSRHLYTTGRFRP